jgi:hypothetical protein
MSTGVDGTGRPEQATAGDAPRARNSKAAEPDVAGEFEAVEALPRVLRVVGTVIAPTTLLTALMFYFGLLYAIAYYRYFGVNYSVLDLSPQDFLILSADAAIPPLTFLAGATLLALWLLRLPLDRLPRRVRRVTARWVAPLLAVVGAGLVAMAMVDAYLGVSVFPAGIPEARGLSLAVGVLLVAYAGRVRRIARPRRTTARPTQPEVLLVAKWASLFVLVAVGLFWAVGSYAIGAGTGNAQGFTAALPCAPEVVLHSDKRLDLRAAGVPEEASPDPEPTYRYPGLRLVPQNGDQYLLLPADWAFGGRPALLVPRSDGLRLDFLLPQC